MRPKIRFLDDALISKIISEARDVLCKLGFEINNENVISILTGHGARIDKQKKRVFLNDAIVEKTLKTAPRSFKLYDVLGKQTHDFQPDNVYFTPGSTALNVLDYSTKQIRKPTTADYINYAKLVSRLEHIASQSTAFIPSDIPMEISDSYRLLLSLLYCEKPVVTGAFTIESFQTMKDMQLAVRGTEKRLMEKPLTIFSCCPTSPLKWSNITSQNLIDCAEYHIPVELVAMPLSGFIAPVTLVGTLIQHTAETLSGIVISQLARPGAPLLYGGSPAVFDVRYETTPMGAIETMMVDCAYSEIGKFLQLPTQAYMALSDAKQLDAQAGLEAGIGAVLAALSGINNISGPGMLDFESCQSLEKLVLDNEICGMALRLTEGIKPKGDFPALPLFEELLDAKHLLIAHHTLQNIKTEHFIPGTVIDRKNSKRWEEDGSMPLQKRANLEVEKLINDYQPSRLSDDLKRQCRALIPAKNLPCDLK
jgi:trimethylamine--corrinoid protein Co-methyltransferase